MRRLSLIPAVAMVTAIAVAVWGPTLGTATARAATPEIGVSLDVIEDYSTSAPFIDVTAMLRRWGKPGAAWEENPALKLTADNCPLQDADALTYLRGYPAGMYTLTFEGTAAVGVSGLGAVVPGSVRKVGTVTSAKVPVRLRQGPDDLLIVQVRQVDPRDPLRNLHLLAPGYTDNKQVFTNAFLKRVRPFTTIRFMDWERVNNSTIVEWADRPRVTAVGRTGAGGVPVEEMVALANATGRNVWFNIPHHASDDYVRQFAKLLHDTLSAHVIVRFEYGNEVWNGMFRQARDNVTDAKANARLTEQSDFGRSAQQAADKLGHFAGIFHAVYGEKDYAARVRPVVGGLVAGVFWAQTQMDWLKAHYPGVAVEIAIAPYFGHSSDIQDIDKPGVTADALFERINAKIDSEIGPWIAQHAALANRFGVPLISYEGGNHLTAMDGTNEKLKQAMQNDPRMGKTYRHLLDVWHQNGGGLFVHYGHIGPAGRFGSWGLLESATQRGSVKWDTFMSMLLPPGDANLDGQVDFADFQVLKAHFGEGRWWEDGDANGDARVDGEDLKIVEGQLKDLTPAQAAEVAGLRGRR